MTFHTTHKLALAGVTCLIVGLGASSAASAATSTAGITMDVMNNTSTPFTLEYASNGGGSWVIPPPQTLPPNSTVVVSASSDDDNAYLDVEYGTYGDQYLDMGASISDNGQLNQSWGTDNNGSQYTIATTNDYGLNPLDYFTIATNN